MFKKKDTADSEQNSDVKGAKGKSQAQVLVLLLLVAVGAYIYFFTGLIKPREEAPVTPPQPAQVKKPMPPRQADQQAEPAGAKPQVASTTAPAPAPTPAPAAPKAAAPAPASAQPAAAQKTVAQAPAKPKASAPVQPAKPAKAETAKTPVKAAPVAANKAADGKSAAPAKPAGKGAAAAGKQAGSAGKAAPAAVKKQETAEKKIPAGAFTLKTADLAFARDVARAEAQLKKAGIKPVAVHKTVKAEPMNRLFYAEYPTREAAAADLEQLKTKAPDAFMVPEGDKFAIYAGSYLKEGRGAIEQDRLFDKGIRLVMKKTQVKIPITYITAGSFASKEEARNAAVKLKKSGVAIAVVKK